MGHFDVACCVSGLPIRSGDKVYAMRISRSRPNGDIACCIDDLFLPASFPVRGEYDGFGGVVVDDREILKAQFNETQLGANLLFVVLRSVWDYMVSRTDTSILVAEELNKLWDSNSKAHSVIKTKSWSSEDEFNKAFMAFEGRDSILPMRGNNPHNGWNSTWKRTIAKGNLHSGDVQAFITRVFKSLTLERHMVMLGKVWIPIHVSGQDSGLADYYKFHKAMGEIASLQMKNDSLEFK